MTDKILIAGFSLLVGLVAGTVPALLLRKRSGYQPAPGQAQDQPPAGGTAVRPAWLSNIQPSPGTAGFTIAAALNGVGCLGRSRADEPVFVLCARDRCASMLVRDWANLAAEMGANDAKVADARLMADRMEKWRAANGGGKVPD